jgi:hypothetical protein
MISCLTSFEARSKGTSLLFINLGDVFELLSKLIHHQQTSPGYELIPLAK